MATPYVVHDAQGRTLKSFSSKSKAHKWGAAQRRKGRTVFAVPGGNMAAKKSAKKGAKKAAKPIKPMPPTRAKTPTAASRARGGKGTPAGKKSTGFGALREKGAGTKKDPARVVGKPGAGMSAAQKKAAGKVFNKAVAKGQNPRYAAAKGRVAATGAGVAG